MTPFVRGEASGNADKLKSRNADCETVGKEWRAAPRDQSAGIRSQRSESEVKRGECGLRVAADGGEGGIRTLGTLLRYGALAKRCFRPLSHLTHCAVEVARISGSFHARQPIDSPMRLASSVLLSSLTITWSIFALTGCASGTRPKTATAAAVKPRVVGEVAVVEEEKRVV